MKELIEELNKAYADEWIAYFYYTWAAEVASGINPPAVVSDLERIAKDELEHQSELAARMLELGGEP
ncbi:MAG: ferritin-like domain-containing protein [Candidatus Bathyarchaeia archaeon]